MKGYQLTPVRIVFWVLMSSILGVVVCLWFFRPLSHRPSDRAVCLMNQRNLQAAVRHQQEELHLKPGDPLDWSKIIGPALLLEKKPLCPIHGEYTYSAVVPEIGTLAAPCRDPEHQRTDTKDW